MQTLSRRSLLSSAAVAIPAIAVSGCGLFTQTATGAYGLSAAAIAYIQDAVNLASSYVPSIESIAAIVGVNGKSSQDGWALSYAFSDPAQTQVAATSRSER